MRLKFLRTKFLTGSRVQLRYLGFLLLSMFVPMVFVGGCLYYLIFNILAEHLGIPEYIASSLVPVVTKINLILLIGVPPLLIVLILWGMVLSHRFAGPIERLEKEVGRVADSGDYKHRIRLRKSDDIRPIADSINKLLDKLEGKTK